MHNFTLRRSVITALGSAVAGLALLRNAAAAELQKLDPRDPAAAALGYVEDATKVNVKAFPAYVKDANCANCLQLQGKAGGDYRPCSVFPGKLVAVSGWCSGWTAEM